MYDVFTFYPQARGRVTREGVRLIALIIKPTEIMYDLTLLHGRHFSPHRTAGSGMDFVSLVQHHSALLAIATFYSWYKFGNSSRHRWSLVQWLHL